MKNNKKHTLLLIEKLEHLSSKKVVLCENEKTNSIFKPLRVNERLEPKRKELIDKGVLVVNDSTKTLTFKSDIQYSEYMTLCTFYKGYIVDVEGDVFLGLDNLSSIDVRFNNVSGCFSCSFNKLTSLRNCPKTVGGQFGCSYNNLTSLEHCPKVVNGGFYCYNNSKQFTKEEILKVCDVKGEIKC